MRDVDKWQPEDESFWHSSSEKIANRNLWISIGSLFCSFAIWMYWGVITVQMINLGFNFTQYDLFSLIAIAGLTGATLRIPNSFFIHFCGGRYTLFFSTALLIFPSIGVGIALQDKSTPLWVFQLMALLSGIGGGNFASSMSNISCFFPKHKRGLALGLNVGLGNFGISAMQILIPLIMTRAVFNNEARQLVEPSATLITKVPIGSDVYIQNSGFIWLLFLVPLLVLSWFSATNIRTKSISPYLGGPFNAFKLIFIMLSIGLVCAGAGLWLFLPVTSNGSGFQAPKEVVLILVIFTTLFCLKRFSKDIRKQYQFFKNKHIWAMSVIYVMTFGSFIGFAAIFALAIKLIFGYQHIVIAGEMTHNMINQNAPSALMYAWMGAFIGALTRPLGGWLGDRFGGATVTQACCIIMVFSALGVSYYMNLAFKSATPEVFFIKFFTLFLVLFAATGVANGSTFKTISVLFPSQQMSFAIGWTSAIAAYGAFYIPCVFAEKLNTATPGDAFINFVVFYNVCLFINWWFYLRKESDSYNP
ncbi:antiporter [Pseudoalteromonas haloplanktis]|uniref:Antiporter n=1 Tax=Pseudoalteromonas haloplanktis TaxID=228 RepID=A0ABU1B9F9_PSEHA|nr:MFS transporter [Pseudoalteromonas haloplanktis]MDQ9090149.1 antiporter [Pseudoalteromonas haloplanktis]